jgi:transposase
MPRIYKRRGSTIKAKIALEAIKEKKAVQELCSEYSVSASQIFAWKKKLEEECDKIFEDEKSKDHQGEIDRLHRVIGQITAERDFLEHVLKR